MCGVCLRDNNGEPICSTSMLCVLKSHALNRKVREFGSNSQTNSNRIHNETERILAFTVEACNPLETMFKVGVVVAKFVNLGFGSFRRTDFVFVYIFKNFNH